MRRFILVSTLVVAPLLAAGGPVRAQADTLVGRLNQLQDDVLAATSATELLTRRCATLHMADPAVIKAVVNRQARGTATAEIRARLKVPDGEPLRYRRVELRCGQNTLSVADNWYVPARLTPAMNAALDSSDTPFGTVVKPLDFHRRTVEMARPRDDAALDQAEHKAGERARLRYATLFQVEAVLLTPQETPISLVIENYQGALLLGPGP